MQAQDLSRIIEMAWEDRTPFEAIEHLYGLNQSAVVVLINTSDRFKKDLQEISSLIENVISTKHT